MDDWALRPWAVEKRLGCAAFGSLLKLLFYSDFTSEITQSFTGESTTCAANSPALRRWTVGKKKNEKCSTNQKVALQFRLKYGRRSNALGVSKILNNN